MRSINTKYLLIFLVVIIGLIIIISYIKLNNLPRKNQQPSPSPINESGQRSEHQVQQKILEEKPWVNSLPLKNPNYYVEYLATEDKIKASIYTFYSPVSPVEQQVDTFKTEILGKLQNLGVDTTKQKIEWEIK